MTLDTPNGGTRPVPDPTALTTQQLLREIQALRELVLAEVRALNDKHDARFGGMDKAIDLIQAAADRVPSEVDIKVGNLQALVFEKFEAVQTQFEERDTRTQETAALNKLAIDAALQAQKEAAGKSEDNFTRQIEKLSELIESKVLALATELRAKLEGLSTQIGANKERLDRIEGSSSGYVESKHRESVGNALALAGVGIMVSLIGIAVVIVVALG